MALEQQIEQLDSQEIQPNQKTIWENKVRENLAHNFLTS